MKIQGSFAELPNQSFGRNLKEMTRCVLLSEGDALPANDVHYFEDVVSCEDIIRKGSATFFMASFMYAWEVRMDIHALYAFCRVTDDLADNPSIPMTRRKSRLNMIENIIKYEYKDPSVSLQDLPLKNIWDPSDSVPELTKKQLCACRSLLRLKNQYCLPLQPILDLMKGYYWDLNQEPIESTQDLIRYSRYVAGTVGELATHIMLASLPQSKQKLQSKSSAVAEDAEILLKSHFSSEILQPSIEMGVGLQLLNIARDIITDAKLGRMYFPSVYLSCGKPFHREEWIERIAQGDLSVEDECDIQQVALKLVQWGETYLSNAVQRGAPKLPSHYQIPVKLAGKLYQAIGEEIQISLLNYGKYPERAVVSKTRKIYLLLCMIYLDR
jgi:15-cis-phytoene synthase/lycopene beta-cyclase